MTQSLIKSHKYIISDTIMTTETPDKDKNTLFPDIPQITHIFEI